MMPKLTPEDEADARKLGVSVDVYRVMKLQVQFDQAKKQADESGEAGPPDDIASEDPVGHFKFLHLWPGQNPPGAKAEL